jgi:hypothetical protein
MQKSSVCWKRLELTQRKSNRSPPNSKRKERRTQKMKAEPKKNPKFTIAHL